MVTVATNYEQVLADYPELVQEFLDNLRNSTSKNKDMDITKIKWFYSWGTFGKKSKSDSDKVLKQEEHKKRMNMVYEDRWEAESEKIKVDLEMVAGSFVRADRCQKEEISPLIVRYAKELLKLQMQSEQKHLEEMKELVNKNVIDSIPEVDQTIIEEIFPPNPAADAIRQAIANAQGGGSTKRKKEITYDLDDILDKISDTGFDSLSDEEREFLKNQSE